MQISTDLLTDEETILESAAPDANADAILAAEQLLVALQPESAAELSALLMQGASGNQPGMLVVNSLSFPRNVIVDLSAAQVAPEVEGPVRAVQFDDTRKLAVVEVPGSGFVWLGEGTQTNGTSGKHVTLAEEYLLRNQLFEVYLNPTTGGIGKVKKYGRSPNQLSQQLTMRYPKERTVVRDAEGNESEKTFYASMRCREMNILSTGPALGEIETVGDIVDEQSGEVLSTYRQVYRIWLGRPVLDIDLTLDVSHQPEGDPWSSYYAMRFAWSSESAALTRSAHQGAHSFRGERIESPWYFEIADESTRTTIVTAGNAFHRKTGPRMLDSLLVTEGESCRNFRFQIALDQDYPMQAALDTLTPATLIATQTGPPRAGKLGWFFHVNVKNVQIQRILPIVKATCSENNDEAETTAASLPAKGFALRMVETEGRHRNVKLRCFRTPSFARQRNFAGETVAELDIKDDAVQIEINDYEICDVELHFE